MEVDQVKAALPESQVKNDVSLRKAVDFVVENAKKA